MRFNGFLAIDSSLVNYKISKFKYNKKNGIDFCRCETNLIRIKLKNVMKTETRYIQLGSWLYVCKKANLSFNILKKSGCKLSTDSNNFLLS